MLITSKSTSDTVSLYITALSAKKDSMLINSKNTSNTVSLYSCFIC